MLQIVESRHLFSHYQRPCWCKPCPRLVVLASAHTAAVGLCQTNLLQITRWNSSSGEDVPMTCRTDWRSVACLSGPGRTRINAAKCRDELSSTNIIATSADRYCILQSEIRPPFTRCSIILAVARGNLKLKELRERIHPSARHPEFCLKLYIMSKLGLLLVAYRNAKFVEDACPKTSTAEMFEDFHYDSFTLIHWHHQN